MLHPDLLALDAELAQVQRKQKEVIANIQLECSHQDVSEAPYESNYYHTFAPLRICTSCGMTEEGWGCGYLVLKSNTPASISREELYRLRRGLAVLEEHKGPLLRKEVTVKDLILNPTRF